MLLRAYTLHDVKALNYSPPFFQHNNAMAIRMLTDLVNDSNTSVGRHPADFKMYCVGSYDDGNGILIPLNIIEHVMDAIACVTPQASLFQPLRQE
ncbi:nonstructural protein [Blackfly microvirus SF02]|uniref:Nonstructural protein n=1 Tax=Blackfly microvirus SF02 TaxID=2576452 RepID=A0A4P8PK55_9VIRU|nr:nonstructural protein [Blackfly microvirus SF02]